MLIPENIVWETIVKCAGGDSELIKGGSLMQKCFHPDRLVYYLENYNYDIGDDEYDDDGADHDGDGGR